MWKITKGSEADFKGAPEWAEECIYTDKNTVDDKDEFLAWVGQGKAQVIGQGVQSFDGNYGYRNYVKARREKIV